MEKVKSFLCRDIGILLCIIFYTCFMAVAVVAKPHLDGAGWYLFSSFQRIVFGLAGLAIFIKIFHRKKWTDVINTVHFKDGILAGSGLILYTAMVAVVLGVGIRSLIDTTFLILFSNLILQQAATGFWEELTFRAFLLEGYAHRERKTWLCRLIYAGISFFIFGFIHAIERDSFKDAIDIFFVTGIFGFVFAAIYLYSHNILVPMLLHFVYDIPANFQQFAAAWNEESRLFYVLNNYVLIAFYIAMIIVSIVFVIKKPVYEKNKES